MVVEEIQKLSQIFEGVFGAGNGEYSGIFF